MKKPTDVLTTGQIANLCRCAPRTVAKWIDDGALKGFRLPGSKDRRVVLVQLFCFMRERGMPLEWLASMTDIQEIKRYCDIHMIEDTVEMEPGQAPKAVLDVVGEILISLREVFGKVVTISKRRGTNAPILTIAVEGTTQTITLQREHVSAIIPILTCFMNTGQLTESMA